MHVQYVQLSVFHYILCVHVTIQDLYIDLKKSNQKTLLEAGSLLLIPENLPSPEAPSLYTRLRGLQRLKVRHNRNRIGFPSARSLMIDTFLITGETFTDDER